MDLLIDEAYIKDILKFIYQFSPAEHGKFLKLSFGRAVGMFILYVQGRKK
jgi:hypothetical protein